MLARMRGETDLPDRGEECKDHHANGLKTDDSQNKKMRKRTRILRGSL